MAQIIEFPIKNRRLNSSKTTEVLTVPDYEAIWERACSEGENGQEDGVLALLNLMEEEPLSPKSREAFSQFLFQQLFDAQVSLEKRESLAAAMAALFMGPEHNKILVPRLVLGTKEERMVAAIAIGFSGNQAALKPLKTAICDSDVDIQKAAAFGLSGLKNGELDGELIGILLDHLELASSADVRAAILVNLKLFARPSLEPVFLSHSYSTEPETQITALGGLLFFCSADGLGRAVELLQSQRPAVRATALSILERHGSRKDLERVFPILGDEDLRVRNLARETMQRLREKGPNSVGWVS